MVHWVAEGGPGPEKAADEGPHNSNKADSQEEDDKQDQPHDEHFLEHDAEIIKCIDLQRVNFLGADLCNVEMSLVVLGL